MIYALDTMVVSEVRKLRPHGGVLDWFATTPIADYAIPAIVFFELQEGVEMKRAQDAEKARELETWIDLLERSAAILPFDSVVARETSRLMVNKSQELFEDAAIAATARVYGLTVATRNTKDFRHFDVPQFNPFQFRA